jgi:hypothetical protein
MVDEDGVFGRSLGLQEGTRVEPAGWDTPESPLSLPLSLLLSVSLSLSLISQACDPHEGNCLPETTMLPGATGTGAQLVALFLTVGFMVLLLAWPGALSWLHSVGGSAGGWAQGGSHQGTLILLHMIVIFLTVSSSQGSIPTAQNQKSQGLSKSKQKPGMVVYTSNPSTQDVEKFKAKLGYVARTCLK